ncbi:MAG: MBL fold metallo-hydrolase [bacterium]|nr:MBL fold metallo-hydrolase [bacterium]MBU1917735.1 MBL fold metallo-hydrolase [bacterium]
MSEITIRYLGHSSLMIHADNINFLFDPNFDVKLMKMKRLDEPKIDQELLHEVQVILISNPHHHRLNLPSFKFLKQAAQLILPLGLSKIVNTYFHFRVTELKAGAQTEVGEIKIIGIKSLHKAFRNCSLIRKNALNYIIKTPTKTIFYCSDSPYDGSYFFDLGKEYNIDVAILPIDHVGLDIFAKNRYMTREQALQAMQDLGAKKMIPYCFGSFNFAGRKRENVLNLFKKDIEKASLEEKVIILEPGQTTQIT